MPKGYTARTKQLIAEAQKQPTLGAQLLTAGIQNVPNDEECKDAVIFLIWKFGDDEKVTPFDVVRVLKGAINGLKDDTWRPEWWEGPTIQSIQGTNMTLEEALDQLGKVDAGAADLVADAVHRAQLKEGDYADTLWDRFAEGFWRGAKNAIKMIGEGGGALLQGAAEGLGWQGFLLVGLAVGIYALAKGGGISVRATHENPRRLLGPLR